MPDSDEPLRQNVQQESPDELFGRKRHFSFLIAMSIVPPTKPDVIAVKRNQSVIGDGHTMGVTPEIAENPFRTTKGRLRIDDPLVAV